MIYKEGSKKYDLFFFFMMYKDGSLKMSNKEIWFWACGDEINKDDEIKIVEI